MPTPVAWRRVTLGVTLVLLMLLAWKLPVLDSVAGWAQLEPAAVWQVVQDGNGQIKTAWDENLIGVGGEQTLLEFERTDVVDIETNPRFRDGAMVSAGDTVATVTSLATESAITELEAELDYARASHAALRAGSRPVDVEVAGQEVAYAQTALDAFLPEYERTKDLHSRGYVALDRLQEVEGQNKILTAALAMAESNLRALKAGAREVDLSVAGAEIFRLERALENAKLRHEVRKVLIAPVNGNIRLGKNSAIIIEIERTDTLVALVTLAETMLSEIPPDAMIMLNLAAGRQVECRFSRVIYRKNPAAGAYVVGIVPNPDRTLRPGMRGKGEVETRPRSLLANLNRTLRSRMR